VIHRRPEILAPAGGHPQLRAAIEAGADAVYFGLTRFNARARAANFSPDELPEIMGQLHERGVRGFVTLNTLVFDRELDDVERYVRTIVEANVDAVIVQDLGLCARMRELYPQLRLHGSTQMTVTSAESAELVGRLGCERVVLGRELSVRDITAISRATDLELEVFVHGALCVSYSGQCFSSEAWGGRSANRGQCAQACRLPYEMIVDGDEMGLDPSYLLSPQDLIGLHHIPDLIQAGVACFKIEGRLKGPDYVAATTRAYRRAVDSAWAGQEAVPDPQELIDLQQVFSRGLAPGFLDGPRHQRLVRGYYPNKRGPRVGEVLDVQGRRITVTLRGPLKTGDGVLIGEHGIGGMIHTLLVDGVRHSGEVDEGTAVLKLGPRVSVDSVGPGDTVWRTKDATLEGRLRPFW
jgi:putative protease